MAWWIGISLFLIHCQPPSPIVEVSSAKDAQTAPETQRATEDQMTAPVVVGNPPAVGFDLERSDTRAIEIADRVMSRLGGRSGWEQTRYLTWRFFGTRRHVWDKWTGNLRFEREDLTVLMNLNDRSGRAWRAGVAVENPDTLAADLQDAYRAWINDSYWLVMPYKLKDSGVTLRYRGQNMTQDGLPAHLLELTFAEVGMTPHNRYEVWVDVHESLVRQWAYYPQAEDEEPRFVMPWQEWTQYGRIWLAADFGRSRHSHVGVFDELSASVFSDPAPTTFHVDP
jgi:hypothetical protein